MKVTRVFAAFVILLMLQACGASGPIKAYDDSKPINKADLSIIYLSPEIELLEVDGNKLESPFIENGLNEIHILPGTHQIAIKYLAYWGTNASGSIVRSQPVVLKIGVEAKSKYYLKFKKPKDQWEALRLSKNFSPWLEDASGNKLASVRRLSGGNKLTMNTEADQPLPGATPLENLKYWWKKAGFNEKKQFEKWMNKN